MEQPLIGIISAILLAVVLACAMILRRKIKPNERSGDLMFWERETPLTVEPDADADAEPDEADAADGAVEPDVDAGAEPDEADADDVEEVFEQEGEGNDDECPIAGARD